MRKRILWAMVGTVVVGVLVIAACLLISLGGMGVSAAAIKRNAARYEDQRIRIIGRGILTAELPLCPGYVGLDARTNFVDWRGEWIVAQPQGSQAKLGHDGLRVFEGYVRVYRGEMGCPGQVKEVTIPYIELMGKEN
jgi:hypothetical protein